MNITLSQARVKAAQEIAEGEEEYMRLLSQAYDTAEKQDFYRHTQALEALKASPGRQQQDGYSWQGQRACKAAGKRRLSISLKIYTPKSLISGRLCLCRAGFCTLLCIRRRLFYKVHIART